MPKIPDYNKPMPQQPKSVMFVCTTDGKPLGFVCTTDGKPLGPEDQKALDEFIQYRIDRAKKQRKAKESK